MLEVRLRDYRPDDVRAMYELDLVCFDPPFRFTERAMRRFAEAPGALTVIAESGSELAGFTIAQMERYASEVTAYVVTLDVAPNHRRQGLARTLMATLQRKAESAGARAMELHVHEGNAAAVSLYRALDYTQIGLQTDFYATGIHGAIYRKPLVLQGSL